MKYGIPVATFFLLGVVFCLHRSVVPGQPRVAGMGDSIPLEPSKALESALRSSEAVESVNPESVPRRKRPEAVAVARAISGERSLKLFVTLNRELTLTTVQQEGVERVLRDRDNEIRECHEGIRRSGVLDIRHYEWQVSVMKASWYRKIDSLLDTVQHERFVAIVEQGLFNDGLVFTHEPGMTVLD